MNKNDNIGNGKEFSEIERVTGDLAQEIGELFGSIQDGDNGGTFNAEDEMNENGGRVGKSQDKHISNESSTKKSSEKENEDVSEERNVKSGSTIQKSCGVIVTILFISAVIVLICFLVDFLVKNVNNRGVATRSGLVTRTGSCKDRAVHKSHPYIVAIIEKKNVNNNAAFSYICAGTIVSHSWILTMSSCFLFKNISNIVIRAGLDPFSPNGTEYKVVSLNEFTEDYVAYNMTKNSKLNTLVALNIKPPFVFEEHIRPARVLPRCIYIRPTQKMSVVGWAIDERDEDDATAISKMTELKTYRVTVAEEEDCSRIWPEAVKKSRYFCGIVKKKNLCGGMEGFPMIFRKKYLVGMLGPSCRYEKYKQTLLFINITSMDSLISKMIEPMHRIKDVKSTSTIEQNNDYDVILNTDQNITQNFTLD